ncbi:hypothetical protein [Bacillus smithii]|uniref:hypothetical protein n=1 Tax=Bacillus smithii TaxID=1479 RepID=UPI0030C92217
MSNFPEKIVRRSIRSFESAAQDVINSTYQTYKARIARLVEIAHKDMVINSIVGPLLKMEIDFDGIHISRDGGFRIDELKLPTDIDVQLAYVLQMFERVVKDEISLDAITYSIYGRRRYEDNIILWFNDVVSPCFRELSYRLNDLVEDEVTGKEEVSTAALQIFNYGSISASQGSNIAIGKEIQQSVSYENIVNKIMDKVRTEQIVSEDKLNEVEEVANEIEEEINKTEPSPSKLKQLAGKLYTIGENALLKVVSTVVTDPRWGQAVAETLMNIY